jgi:indole-3-glycerol phosphate synthase
MSDFLKEIVARKKREVEKLPTPKNFAEVLNQGGLSVIAEIKRKSPSKGVLNGILDPVELAKKYVAGGASALSVLTDQEGFGGTLEDLRAVIAACPGIPVLRKDFILDVRQIDETARAGAHAVLLIVAVLGERLAEFVQTVRAYGMQALVEVHDLEELRLAQAAKATLIGVNNRNLSTFEVSLSIAETLAPHFSSGIIKVAESGIQGASDALRMQRAGYDAVLVGEALVKVEDPGRLIQEFKNAN